jgi:hypothetical protein
MRIFFLGPLYSVYFLCTIGDMPTLKSIFSSILVATLCITHTSALTVSESANVYSVNEGVSFDIANSGASNFLFSWNDPSPSANSFSELADPTLVLTIGETYTFQRTSSLHPFIIMDNNASAFIAGTDGSYLRTTSDSALISAATLTPVANFTADPSPTTDFISWTPDALGDFWYTCSVSGHTGMTGLISVVPEPSSFALIASATAFALACLRRRVGLSKEAK